MFTMLFSTPNAWGLSGRDERPPIVLKNALLYSYMFVIFPIYTTAVVYPSIFLIVSTYVFIAHLFQRWSL